MQLDWTEERHGEDSYFHARLDSRDPRAHEDAIALWWQKLCDLAGRASDWDTIVGDLWVETGRIIGHVQRADQAIGMDRGFRVCLGFAHVVSDLHAAEHDEASYSAANQALFRLLDRSIRAASTRARLVELGRTQPFGLWWCRDGQLDAEPVTPT